MDSELIPEWVWTSDIVMGWCDSGGCNDIGHKGNNCGLARAFAAHLSGPSSPDRLKEAKEAVIEAAKRWHPCVRGTPREHLIEPARDLVDALDALASLDAALEQGKEGK